MTQPQPQTITTSNTITYRNAIYQGDINSSRQTREDFGIIYLATTHEFIVCNNWHNDSLQGECLFYNDDKKFIYGTWINNIPQGFNVFRLNDVLLMAEFRRGRLVRNTPMLIVFEKYNLAGVLIVVNDAEGLDDLQLEIINKRQVFTSQDVRQLFEQCQWPEDYFRNNHTLIKYISYKLAKSPLTRSQNNKQIKNPCKLRLVDSKYYRFGYDDGLAIIFDEDFNRVSVGSHFKSKLKSFGIEFDRPGPVIKPEKGKVIKINPVNNVLKTAIKNQYQKTQRNVSTQKQISKTNLLTGVNFCNKFYKNPSKLFQFFIQNIINESSIRNLISGSLTTRKLFEQSLQFSRIESVKGNNISNDQIIFNSNQIQHQLTKIEEQIIMNEDKNKLSGSRLSKKKIIQDRLRLEAIKKEIYESLQSKRNKIQKQIKNQQYQREIIHKEIVGNKSRYHTPQKTLDKSRSRKRIFQQSQKNLKLLRDFTPTRSQPNLTPFRTKMKSRIFNGQTSKFSQNRNYRDLSKSKSRNKSRQRTYTYADEQQSIQIRPAVLKNQSKFSSGVGGDDSLDDERGQNNNKMIFQRDRTYQRQQEDGIKQQFSLINNDDYHVSFEDNNNRDLNDNKNNNNRQIVQKNSRYPSQSNKGYQHNYVPINSSEVKERKRSSRNFISIKDDSDEHVNNNTNTNNIQAGSYRIMHENERRSVNKLDSINNIVDNTVTQKQQQQSTNIQPQIRYYLKSSQSSAGIILDGGSFRSSKRDSLQMTLKQQRQQQKLNKNNNNNNNSNNNNNNNKKLQVRRYQQIQVENRQQQQPTERFEKKHQQIQHNQLTINNQQPITTTRKQIYNEDTFKQNTLGDVQGIGDNNNDQSRRSLFRHSNQVYLQQYHDSKQSKTRQDQGKGSVRKALQYSHNRSPSSSLVKNETQRMRDNNSYTQMHKRKKSMEKSMEKSPDHHRCYGRTDNSPYLQGSIQYQKQLHYQSSSKQQVDLLTNKRKLVDYDDSSYKLMKKEISGSIRNYPKRLF